MGSLAPSDYLARLSRQCGEHPGHLLLFCGHGLSSGRCSRSYQKNFEPYISWNCRERARRGSSGWSTRVTIRCAYIWNSRSPKLKVNFAGWNLKGWTEMWQQRIFISIRGNRNSVEIRERASLMQAEAFETDDGRWLDLSSVRNEDPNDEESGIDLSAHLREKDYPKELRRASGEGMPLTDSNARRLIKMRTEWEKNIRRSRGPRYVSDNRWLKRSPEEMEAYRADGRWQARWHARYNRRITNAIGLVSQLSKDPLNLMEMRKIMAPFTSRLSFREMCVVLKEQRNWKLASTFFEWMKLQVSYKPSVIPYTILLKVYTQAGKLRLAEQALIEMIEVGCEPDEVVFCTLIMAYSSFGKLDEMLEVYEAMRQREIIPAMGMFTKMMSSLNNAGRLSEAAILWEHVLDLKLDSGPYCYSLMINVYRKLGRLPEVVRVYKKMQASGYAADEITLNMVIDVMGKLGLYEAASQVFRNMEEQGIVLNKHSYSTMMNVCCRAGDFKGAADLFADMRKSGCPPDEVVYGTVITAYGNVGLYEEAEGVFEEMQELDLLSDVKTYTAMAQVRVKAEKYEQARELFEVLQARNIPMNDFAWKTFLNCCVKERNVTKASGVFERIQKEGLADVVVYTNMVSLYASLGQENELQQVISQMQVNKVEADVEFFGALIKNYSRLGKVDDIEKTLREMEKVGLFPNQHIKAMMIQAYGKADRVEDAEAVFKSISDVDMVTVGAMSNLYVNSGRHEEALSVVSGADADCQNQNQLIWKFAKSGNLKAAESLLSQMTERGCKPSEAALGAMIALYGRKHQFENARSLFDGARKTGLSKVVYNAMVDACAKCKRLEEAEQLFTEMETVGIGHDQITATSMIDAYTKAGMFAEAESLVENALSKSWSLDTVAYNAILKAFLEAGKLDKAITMFSNMQTAGVVLSLQTYSIAIRVFSEAGEIEKASALFKILEASGIALDEKAYSHMISCYGKAGKVEEARELFKKLQSKGLKPHTVTYNTMIDAYAKSGEFDQASNVFDQMSKLGVSPDDATYLSLLAAYGNSKKRCVEAEKILVHMKKETWVVPDVRHYTAVMRAYGRAWMVDDAHRVFSEMVEQTLNEPDIACYRVMMKIFTKCSRFDEGAALFAKIRKSEKPPDRYLYTLAVDLYARTKRHEEAKSLVTEMERLGFQYQGRWASIWAAADRVRSKVSDNKAATTTLKSSEQQLRATRKSEMSPVMRTWRRDDASVAQSVSGHKPGASRWHPGSTKTKIGT